jgi:antitoxin (DNA-binding transcriptional repressor) of toxin-antitoxin stability system
MYVSIAKELLMKTLEIHNLAEHLNEILRMIKEEGETIEVTDGSEVIAHLVPVDKSPQPKKRDREAFWKRIDKYAAELGSQLPEKVDAVEIIRDVRREL